MKYFLVGYMASGKTHCGRKMALETNLKFIDLDEYIVHKEERSISQIFKEKGEAIFRNMETRYLAQICENEDNFILSTGGGTPCFNNNMEYMNKQGETIFLNVSVEEITRRLIRGKYKRPLVSNLNDEEIFQFVEKHLNERLPYYTKAKKFMVPPIE